MISHFRSQPCTGRKPRPPALPPPEAVLGIAGAADQPLAPLLESLRGQEVELILVGGRIIGGKLLSASPITVVDCKGSVSVVTALVQSASY